MASSESILSDVVQHCLPTPPLATLTLDRPSAHLWRPVGAHADWRGLPDAAVAKVLARLPVLDLFRLGYLFSPRWLDIWRAEPLCLHDRQFAYLPIPVSDVADAITNVLEEHVGVGGDGEGGGNDVGAGFGAGVDHLGVVGHGVEGGSDESCVDDEGGVDDGGQGVEAGVDGGEDGDDDGIFDDGGEGGNGGQSGIVYSFRVESTEWRADHAARWCAALKRGQAREVVLANRGFSDEPRLLAYLPSGLRECTILVRLYLVFFTVEAGDLDALTRLRALGLYGCACRPGVVERAVAPRSDLRVLSISHGALDAVVVASSRLRRLIVYNTAVRTVTVDNVPFLHRLAPGTAPSKLSISQVPALRKLWCLDLATTVLEIGGTKIEVGMRGPHPQMRSVTDLTVIVDYTEMGGMVPLAIEQMLRCFPCVSYLQIMRKDNVSPGEGHLLLYDRHIYQNLNLYDGLECVTRYLRSIWFSSFRGGKAELALIKALLDKVQVVVDVSMVYHISCPGDVLSQMNIALHSFISMTPNQNLRNNPFNIGYYRLE